MAQIFIYALLFVCLALAVRGSIKGLKSLPPYIGPLGRTWYITFRVICGAILLFLITPILVIIPLSFNSEPYFTYPMPGFSLRWYENFISGEQAAVWQLAIKNSIIVAIFATLLATGLGTIAAVGLSNSRLPGKTLLMGLLISPMIVPLVITAVGMYFFYSSLGITPRQLSTIWSGLHLFPVIIAHAALGTPFVVITVTATLVGFDQSLTRASASLGADGLRTFFKVTVPLVQTKGAEIEALRKWASNKARMANIGSPVRLNAIPKRKAASIFHDDVSTQPIKKALSKSGGRAKTEG